MSALYLLNGWAVNESVLKPLQQQLSEIMPCQVISFSQYHHASLESSLSYLKQTIPEHSVVVGWSLGGMLAVQLAAIFPLKALACLGSNPRFVANGIWPMAMDSDVFAHFYQNTVLETERNLVNFWRLCIQGDRSLRRLSVRSCLDIAPGHKALLEGLDRLSELDNTALISQLSLPQLHLFAEQDALVPSQAHTLFAQKYPHLDSYLLPNMSHAFPLSHAQMIAQLIRTFLMAV